MKKVLVIEDEKNLSRFIELELRHESFDVGIAYDGKKGLQMALTEDWDIILLDLMLDGLDGMEVCQQIRKLKKTPIIMITARNSVTDRVMGLDNGADDYIPKPFAIEELLARMRVAFRHQQELQESSSPESASWLRHGALAINLDSRQVIRGEEELELTRREFDLLSVFIANIQRVLSRQTLLDKVWGFDAAYDTNLVDVYVRYLRNKIDLPGEPSYIQTLRGVGYMMKV